MKSLRSAFNQDRRSISFAPALKSLSSCYVIVLSGVLSRFNLNTVVVAQIIAGSYTEHLHV